MTPEHADILAKLEMALSSEHLQQVDATIQRLYDELPDK